MRNNDGGDDENMHGNEKTRVRKKGKGELGREKGKKL